MNLVPRPRYHKNGTQWIGKILARLVGENIYEWIRIEKRIMYGHFWYTKQIILFHFQTQYPYLAVWFSLLNKQDTSTGFPAKRQYERYQDFAVFNINHEGWFQLLFALSAGLVIIWNWWTIAFTYEVRGHNVEDDDLYRYKDARVYTNFDRTKYNFDHYFFATHYNAVIRHGKASIYEPEDARMNWRPHLRGKNPYGLDRYVKYYGFSQNMRLV